MDQSCRLPFHGSGPGIGRKLQKKTLILLEIILALTLTAFLLNILFHCVVRYARNEVKIDQASAAVHKRAHTYQRLQHVFHNVEQEFEVKEDSKNKVHIYTIFDNGVDPDPVFSKLVKGDLFLNDNEQLCLKISAMNKQVARNEILANGVKKCSFQFLSKQRDWKTLWDVNEGIPKMIRLTIVTDQNWQCAFFPNVPHIILCKAS